MSEPHIPTPVEDSVKLAQSGLIDDELEPQLKYERLGSDVKTILQDRKATFLCLSEKILALGTDEGSIHLLDYSGNEVKRLKLHSSPIKHLSFDTEAEYLASCGTENYVSISNLYTDESNKYTFKRQIKVVALDPRYASRKTREFVTGDIRGRLKLSSQGWLGRSDHVLHTGEGAIQAVQWQSTILAWANDVGVKVYDTGNHQFIGSISRPKNGRFPDCFNCHLYLHDASCLYVAWADCIKVSKVVSCTDSRSGAVIKNLHTVTHFTTDYLCMGVVPHGDDLAVLAYITDDLQQQQQDKHEQQQQQQDKQEQPQQQQQQEQQQQQQEQVQQPDQEQQQQQQQQSQEVQVDQAKEAAETSTVSALPEEQQDTASTTGTGQLQDITIASTLTGSLDEDSGAPAAAAAASSEPAGSSAAMDASTSAVGDAAATDEASTSGAGSTPINMPAPRPHSRTGRAANAVVRSPGATAMVLQAVAAGQGMAAASAAASTTGSTVTDNTVTSQGNRPAGLSSGAVTTSGKPPLAPSSSTPSPKPSPTTASSSRAVTSATGAVTGGVVSSTESPVLHPYRPPGQPLRPELRIVTSSNEERASDALSIKAYEAYLPEDFQFVPSYGNEVALASCKAATAASGSSSTVCGVGEFMYFIVSPQDIVIGRYRDVEDRISWFLEHRRFESALKLAERERGLPPTIYEAAVQAYLEYLVSEQMFRQAANLLPRLLKDQTALWERWVYIFAQARQLPLLAPVLPTKKPQLRQQTYEMVLQSLLADPAHHEDLLTLVQTWPNSLYPQTVLIDAIAHRMRRVGGETRELWRALAHLYKMQGRPDLSLAIYLQLQLPSVFEFILEYNLLSFLDRKAALLMRIDEHRALELLVAHYDAVPPSAVMPGLLEALQAAESAGDESAREVWRLRIHKYLHNIFVVDPTAAPEYHELQVHLYADYQPDKLMDFLVSSQYYPLEAAYEICEQRGMVDEQVFILSRMGNCRKALALIIEQQHDIPRAIEFVRQQRDDELWEELIDWALRGPGTTGQLLDHIGGNINPLLVIDKIPLGMPIDHLRDRLRAIISDFRTQTSLREGCNAILRSDCRQLMLRLQREARRALPLVYLQRLEPAGSNKPAQWLRYTATAGGGGAAAVVVSAQELPATAMMAAAAATAGNAKAGQTQPGATAATTSPPPALRSGGSFGRSSAPVKLWVGYPLRDDVMASSSQHAGDSSTVGFGDSAGVDSRGAAAGAGGVKSSPSMHRQQHRRTARQRSTPVITLPSLVT